MIFNQTYVSPPYAPLIWNDTGKYNYFYIDFKKTLAPFSMGMFVESILVYGTAPITITALEKINATTCKVYADISGLTHGLVVMSKSPTRLKLSTGKELPAFSTFTFVAGVASYIDGGYMYDYCTYVLNSYTASENVITTLCDVVYPESIESIVYTSLLSNIVTENATITLI